MEGFFDWLIVNMTTNLIKRYKSTIDFYEQQVMPLYIKTLKKGKGLPTNHSIRRANNKKNN
tara:strand:+ start:12504 stop:12686 length:183 start_codon:yes stop_codon:yes gene_type:complete